MYRHLVWCGAREALWICVFFINCCLPSSFHNYYAKVSPAKEIHDGLANCCWTECVTDKLYLFFSENEFFLFYSKPIFKEKKKSTHFQFGTSVFQTSTFCWKWPIGLEVIGQNKETENWVIHGFWKGLFSRGFGRKSKYVSLCLNPAQLEEEEMREEHQWNM